ncbi:MAG: dUTP diphosphatase [Deltaproteobacteria bacterium]|nr:dUTP diphosphatase [Deltaproteobacteria bacterium]
MPVIKVLRLRPSDDPLSLPSYATPGSAGLDVAADVPAALVIPPLGRARVPTGFAIEVPPGFEVQVRPRSGLAARHGVTVLNAPGTIDSDYRGEVQVLLVNFGDAPFTVRRGDRIAQLVPAAVARAEVVEADRLDETDRGAGGFGHTG